MIRRLFNQVAHLVAPPTCYCCGEPELSGVVLCSGCEQRLHKLHGPKCTRCAYPSAVETHGCPRCEGFDWGQDSVTAAVAYDGAARALVAAFKSRRSVETARFMAKLMGRSLPDRLDVEAVVPVPESAKRKRKYGFNQAELLAAALAADVGIPRRRILKRCASGRQVGLARAARLDNARGAFVTRSSYRPRRVLLADDVITTCATMASCAGALKAAGVEEVHCIAFARTLSGQNRGAR